MRTRPSVDPGDVEVDYQRFLRKKTAGPADKPIMAVRKTAIMCMLAVWAAVVGAGARELLRYGNTPGEPGSPPAGWPVTAPVALARTRFTMLLFAHPQCPCSRASIGELSGIIAGNRGRVEATVLFFSPSSLP